MLASRVLITAGTPGHMYLDDKQAKWLRVPEGWRRNETQKHTHTHTDSLEQTASVLPCY